MPPTGNAIPSFSALTSATMESDGSFFNGAPANNKCAAIADLKTGSLKRRVQFAFECSPELG